MCTKQPIKLFALLGASCVAFGAGNALADDSREAAATHEHHHAAMQSIVSTVSYEVPDIALVRADGKAVSLTKEMNDGRPVVLNFIYTSCTSVCPVMSQMFSLFQQQMGPAIAGVHMMSISIDPEADTPTRLTEYAKTFEAGSTWQFYTGTVAASAAAQRAFGVYRGDKMNHTVVTLMRTSPGEPWRRIDGFMTPDAMMHEYHQLIAAR